MAAVEGWTFQSTALWQFTQHVEPRFVQCLSPYAKPLQALAHAQSNLKAVYYTSVEGDQMEIVFGAYCRETLINTGIGLLRTAFALALRQYGPKHFENKVLERLDSCLGVKVNHAKQLADPQTLARAIQTAAALVDETTQRCETAYRHDWAQRVTAPGVAEWKCAVLTAAALTDTVTPFLINDVLNLSIQTFNLDSNTSRKDVDDAMADALWKLKEHAADDENERNKDGNLLMCRQGVMSLPPWRGK